MNDSEDDDGGGGVGDGYANQYASDMHQGLATQAIIQSVFDDAGIDQNLDFAFQEHSLTFLILKPNQQLEKKT